MLAFLHTSGVHVATFERLLRELDATVPVRHEVREELLAAALEAGAPIESVRVAVARTVEELSGDGARLIVCTCSTLGGMAEAANGPNSVVMRIDRPVAEHAVASGRRILLVAALPTALEQTSDLLRQVASRARRSPEIVEVLCGAAWECFERGDLASYIAAVATALRSHAVAGDLVLLAQASMAPVAEEVDRADITVLSSPRPGVRAALEAYAHLL